MHRILTSAACAAFMILPSLASAEPTSLADFALNPRIQAKLDSGADLDIFVSVSDISTEFAAQLRIGVEQGDALDGINATFIGPIGGGDADAQINEIEALLDTMDGLAIASVSTDALAPLIDRVLADGIPVIAYNTDNPDSGRLVFAGQDLVQSGREAGKLMGDVLGGSGKVIITTLDAAAQWSLDRESGAREALAAFPGIEVVSTLNTGHDAQEMYGAIENAMLANPDVTGLLSLECCSTPAAGNWVERNDMVGKVQVVGFDLLEDTMDMISKKTIAATIDQNPVAQGFAAVDLLARFLKGETIDDFDTGVAIYTPENIAEVMK